MSPGALRPGSGSGPPPTADAAGRPPAAPEPGGPSVCPHCWNVNPGAFTLCARCGARMDTLLQESAGLQRTAAVQSPVPVSGARLGPVARVVLAAFVAVMALGYLAYLLPPPPPRPAATAAP